MASDDRDRKFLLFLPIDSPNLKAVLSYYSSYVLVNPEGDVHVSDEGRRGLGNTFLHIFFGFFFQILRSKPVGLRAFESITLVESPVSPLNSTIESVRSDIPWDPGEKSLHSKMAQIATTSTIQSDSLEESHFHTLTTLLPDPGYFIAGGIAGAVSRTATAPLDRLKVYLIAQTNVKRETIDAVKSGAPLRAAKNATGPLLNATLDLWRMGGVRSLFAGARYPYAMDRMSDTVKEMDSM